MNVNGIDEKLFVCPVTKTNLTFTGNSFKTTQSEYIINEDHGYPDFIPYGLKELEGSEWDVWRQLQANGEVSYLNDPTNNLGVGPRRDFIQFAEFCNFRGTVLDIGVGPQILPTHLAYSPNKDFSFIGIDPLKGQQPREYPFVLGLGEFLPFRDNAFDQTLFVTSLDHFLDPVRALNEAKRVTKSSGEICIWIGEKSKQAKPPAISPEWYIGLTVPAGADDPFHFSRFTLKEFDDFLKKVSLKVLEKQEIVVDEWRRNLFFKLSI